MIPPFDDNGFLPQGIHRATFNEVSARFGKGSAERIVQTKELRRFVEWCSQNGVQRLIVNGSYVTDKQSPIDVDIVILPAEGAVGTQLPPILEDLCWPFLQIHVAVDEADLLEWATVDFGTTRELRFKGVVEITQ